MEKDPLSALHDIHLPQPGGFWPPAPGWWLVALVAVLLVAGAVMLVLRRRRRNRWLRQALRELDLTGFSQRSDQQQLVELNQLIKRAARARYPDQHPESLSGERWIGFLVQTCPARERITNRRSGNWCKAAGAVKPGCHLSRRDTR